MVTLYTITLHNVHLQHKIVCARCVIVYQLSKTQPGYPIIINLCVCTSPSGRGWKQNCRSAVFLTRDGLQLVPSSVTGRYDTRKSEEARKSRLVSLLKTNGRTLNVALFSDSFHKQRPCLLVGTAFWDRPKKARDETKIMPVLHGTF